MIRSMTGFARRERAASFGTLAWELRTVNHRYLEVTLRLPEDFRASEGEFRQAIAGVVRRGKVEAALYFRPSSTTSPELELNEPLLDRLVEQANHIRRRLADVAEINVVDLLRWPGVVREAEGDSGPQVAAAHELLAESLEALAECDALATLGDPWMNLDAAQNDAAFLGFGDKWEERYEARCRAELEQAHGRLRTVHRTRPGRALHVGAVLPGGLGWENGEVRVERLKGGRPERTACGVRSTDE